MACALGQGQKQLDRSDFFLNLLRIEVLRLLLVKRHFFEVVEVCIPRKRPYVHSPNHLSAGRVRFPTGLPGATKEIKGSNWFQVGVGHYFPTRTSL